MEKINTSVMYVEDDRISREYAEKMLRITVEDYQMAENGKQALAKILDENYLPEFIITDLKMPEINGLDLVAFIKKVNNYHPKIIVITGHSEIPTIMEMLKDDIIKIFQKPIDFRDILNTIKEVKGIN